MALHELLSAPWSEALGICRIISAITGVSVTALALGLLIAAAALRYIVVYRARAAG